MDKIIVGICDWCREPIELHNVKYHSSAPGKQPLCKFIVEIIEFLSGDKNEQVIKNG